MHHVQRKTTPKVRGGKVQKKHTWRSTPRFYAELEAQPVVDRERPGAGYRHLLKQQDVHRFIDILPNWIELSCGLRTVLLAPGEPDVLGWHDPGIVAICAWEMCMWTISHIDFLDEHRALIERLAVPWEQHGRAIELQWTEGTARAFQLVHILLHELGHHHDCITTRPQRRASRGEVYAEDYARRHEEFIWDRYVRQFGTP